MPETSSNMTTRADLPPVVSTVSMSTPPRAGQRMPISRAGVPPIVTAWLIGTIQGSGSAKSRLAHAVTSAFLARSDTGLTVPNYSYLLGDLSSAALSNLYYPKANRGASLVFTIAAVGLAGRIGGNILREFSKRVTTNAPRDGKS